MEFQKELTKLGLYYPPDPGSMAVSTMGGNVAENAGGMRAVKAHTFWLKVMAGVMRPWRMSCSNFDIADLFRPLQGSKREFIHNPGMRQRTQDLRPGLATTVPPGLAMPAA